MLKDRFGKTGPDGQTGGLPSHWKRKPVKPSVPAAALQSSQPAARITLVSLEDLKMQDLFRLVVDHNGSDIHICVGVPPVLRVHGKIVKTDLPKLDISTVRRLIFEILTDD